jgi:hypothetical protein
MDEFRARFLIGHEPSFNGMSTANPRGQGREFIQNLDGL